MYHLGFTMRFPRALQIRDDLSIADCMTASGTSQFGCGTLFATPPPFRCPLMQACLAVLESIRSEKKRKMEDDDEYVVSDSLP